MIAKIHEKLKSDTVFHYFTGEGVYMWKNGDLYKGSFSEDQIQGQGSYTYKSGDRFVGSFEAWKRKGQGTYFWINGNRFLTFYHTLGKLI